MSDQMIFTKREAQLDKAKYVLEVVEELGFADTDLFHILETRVGYLEKAYKENIHAYNDKDGICYFCGASYYDDIDDPCEVEPTPAIRVHQYRREDSVQITTTVSGKFLFRLNMESERYLELARDEILNHLKGFMLHNPERGK